MALALRRTRTVCEANLPVASRRPLQFSRPRPRGLLPISWWLAPALARACASATSTAMAARLAHFRVDVYCRLRFSGTAKENVKKPPRLSARRYVGPRFRTQRPQGGREVRPPAHLTPTHAHTPTLPAPIASTHVHTFTRRHAPPHARLCARVNVRVQSMYGTL